MHGSSLSKGAETRDQHHRDTFGVSMETNLKSDIIFVHIGCGV
jgi:hypothetical protein